MEKSDAVRLKTERPLISYGDVTCGSWIFQKGRAERMPRFWSTEFSGYEADFQENTFFSNKTQFLVGGTTSPTTYCTPRQEMGVFFGRKPGVCVETIIIYQAVRNYQDPHPARDWPILVFFCSCRGGIV